LNKIDMLSSTAECTFGSLMHADSIGESSSSLDLVAEAGRLARLRSLLFGPSRQGRGARTDHDCFYRTLVEGALDLITVVDEVGTIVFSSPSSERLLGYAPGDLVGRNLFEQVHPDDVRRVRSAFEDGVRGDKTSQPVEHRVRHRNGSWRTFESVGNLRHDVPGGPLGIINSRDVTARKLLEMQVRQAQKMEAVGLMTGAIAHDFNNLMVVIAGYAELLSSDPSSTVREFAGEMLKATDRATELTRQLLTFARPSKVDQLPTCDANEVIVGLQGILERLVGKDVVIGYALAATLARVPMIRASLDQILINLAVNARDAMPGGGHLTIATRNAVLSKPGEAKSLAVDCLVLEVSDTGVGMAEEIKARIFEPFFTTKEPHRGTGLGLQTVFAIVQQADGWIDVMSERDRGTTFRVCVPVHAPLFPST
jgi:two-component system cell cycle sensor histidine kinase/response regulator CckA